MNYFSHRFRQPNRIPKHYSIYIYYFSYNLQLPNRIRKPYELYIYIYIIVLIVFRYQIISKRHMNYIYHISHCFRLPNHMQKPYAIFIYILYFSWFQYQIAYFLETSIFPRTFQEISILFNHLHTNPDFPEKRKRKGFLSLDSDRNYSFAKHHQASSNTIKDHVFHCFRWTFMFHLKSAIVFQSQKEKSKR